VQKKRQTPVAAVLADEQKDKDTPSSDPSLQLERRHSKGRQIMNLIKNPFSSSNNHSAKLSHIQSSAMTDDDKTKSLAVFHLDGLDLATTTRGDAFMQDSWQPEPVITKKQEVKKADKPTHAQKSDESPKKKGVPPRPPLPHQKLFDETDRVKPPLAQRNSVQPYSDSNHLKKPCKPVQRSHSSAGSSGSNRINTDEVNQPLPPAIAPRNHRPTSQLPQGLKKPLIPPVRRSSAKLHNHTGNESKFCLE